MKNITIIITIILIWGLSACEKNESDNKEVDYYIKLLKMEKYDNLELPDFTYKDIPALLKYRNDRMEIKKFPTNPLSSTAVLKCSLGMYVLWTIESIRITAVENRTSIGRYASLVPAVTDTNYIHYINQTTEIQNIVANAYYKWWNENKYKKFDEFKNINPLSKTKYRWK